LNTCSALLQSAVTQQQLSLFATLEIGNRIIANRRYRFDKHLKAGKASMQAFVLKRSINLRLQKVYMRHLLKTCSALSHGAVTLNILALPVAFIIPSGIISNRKYTQIL
jgi:hypothetical protein